jgi:hypothetical protein
MKTNAVGDAIKVFDDAINTLKTFGGLAISMIDKDIKFLEELSGDGKLVDRYEELLSVQDDLYDTSLVVITESDSVKGVRTKRVNRHTGEEYSIW